MKTKFLTLATVATLLFVSCDDDDPQIVNEEEVITTVELTFTNTMDANDVVVLTSQDLDGDGPNAPTVSVSGPFTAGNTYAGMVEFLNELETPAEDITEEVEEEGEEHEVFYVASNANLSVTKTDVDAAGNPLGVLTTLTAAAAGMTDLTVVLRHEPMKPNNGSLADAGGETDVEVQFSVTVQ